MPPSAAFRNVIASFADGQRYVNITLDGMGQIGGLLLMEDAVMKLIVGMYPDPGSGKPPLIPVAGEIYFDIDSIITIGEPSVQEHELVEILVRFRDKALPPSALTDDEKRTLGL